MTHTYLIYSIKRNSEGEVQIHFFSLCSKDEQRSNIELLIFCETNKMDAEQGNRQGVCAYRCAGACVCIRACTQ